MPVVSHHRKTFRFPNRWYKTTGIRLRQPSCRTGDVKPLPIFQRRDLSVWAAIVVSVLSWASAWVSIRVAIGAFSPGQLALGRYLVASLVLLPLALRNRPRFERRDWGWIGLSGVCGFSVYNLAINTGERTISAGAAALIASTIPVLVTLGAHFALGQRASKRTWLASLVSMSGIAILSLGGQGGIHLSIGALWVLLASFGGAAYQLIQIQLRPRYGALDLTAAAMLMGTFALLPFGGGLLGAIRAAPFSANANLVVLGVLPGALGYVLWSWALSQWAAPRVMNFLFLIAPVAVLLGWVFLAELPSRLELCGGALALGGVVWCQTEKRT